MAEFPQPALRISATFPASDGSCPEHMEVEFNEPVQITSALITDVIGALAAVPHARYQPTADRQK